MDWTFLILLLITIMVSFVVVRIGGFALELTGIEPDVARFQALSAFSGTGFTTAEAERVVRNRTRRRIVTILIILGNAGLVTMMATLVASFTEDGNNNIFGNNVLDFLIRLAIIITGIVVFYNLIIRSRVGADIVGRFRKPLLKRIISEAPPIDEIYLIGRYWGVSLVTIQKDSKNIGLSIADIIVEKNLQILEIDRAGVSITSPDNQDKVMAGDRLLVYGKRQDIKQLVA